MPGSAERIRRWAAEGRQQAWWKEYSDVLADSVDVYLDYESGASVIRTYAALVLPGLLQTDAYATRLLKIINPRLTREQTEKLVQLRLHRQELLLDDSEDATRLIAVIDEAAVRRAAALPGGTGRKQLEHLRTTSLRPNVSLRVIPLEVGLHAGVMGTFTVFQFTDDIDRDVVSIEAQVEKLRSCPCPPSPQGIDMSFDHFVELAGYIIPALAAIAVALIKKKNSDGDSK